ncbi:MAG: hypothetical protein LBL67_06330, partial [Coriobacteriales bacterium]|nr:hypothetical protein [Coriobacteriales bacterium]
MKVVNAVWEERNLGVKCHEITIEPGDEPTLVKDDLASAEAEYTVVRVPVACPEWHRALETQGYTFVEAAVTCAHETAELPPLLPKQRRLLESCSCVRLQQDELPLLESHMHKGLFTTDRIALDPHFSVGQANRRYLLWIKDEFARGGLLYWVEAGGQKVGFFGLKPA